MCVYRYLQNKGISCHINAVQFIMLLLNKNCGDLLTWLLNLIQGLFLFLNSYAKALMKGLFFYSLQARSSESKSSGAWNPACYCIWWMNELSCTFAYSTMYFWNMLWTKFIVHYYVYVSAYFYIIEYTCKTNFMLTLLYKWSWEAITVTFSSVTCFHW